MALEIPGCLRQGVPHTYLPVLEFLPSTTLPRTSNLYLFFKPTYVSPADEGPRSHGPFTLEPGRLSLFRVISGFREIHTKRYKVLVYTTKISRRDRRLAGGKRYDRNNGFRARRPIAISPAFAAAYVVVYVVEMSRIIPKRKRTLNLSSY